MNEQEAVTFGKAVGDLTRQRILRYCCCEERSVGDIADHVGVTQPTASHHLSLLEKAHLVDRIPDGKTVYYRVDQKRIVSCCGNLLLNLAPNDKATRAAGTCC